VPPAKFNRIPIVPAAVHPHFKREPSLTAMTQELAGLRFSIHLLSRWERSRNVDPENLKALRRELAELRALYFAKIDDLAMAFGVAQAMKTKQSVERSVIVPGSMAPHSKGQPEQLPF
jgi:hypothetical protein